MGGVGIGLLWVAYTGGLWGWSLITGRNVALKQLLSFTQWPPVSPSQAGGTSAASMASGPGPIANAIATQPPASKAGANAATEQYFQSLTGSGQAPIPGVSSQAALNQGLTDMTGWGV